MRARLGDGRLRAAQRRRKRKLNEGGWSVIELSLASMLTLVVTAALATTLWSGLKTTSFGSNQSISLDGARGVLQQVSRDLQGSKQFQTCTLTGVAAGGCAVAVVQPPSGADQTVRYRLVDTTLYRDVDDGTGTFPSSRALTTSLANASKSPAVSLFSCATPTSLLQVTIRMVVQPNPKTSPTYDLETIVRPRNTYQPSAC